MAYSDWQLNRLRDALRAYHDDGGRSLKEDFNWNSVAEGIAVELNELLILGGVAVAVGGWFLAHRHGQLRGMVAASAVDKTSASNQ